MENMYVIHLRIETWTSDCFNQIFIAGKFDVDSKCGDMARHLCSFGIAQAP
jgi:hypothetical protein